MVALDVDIVGDNTDGGELEPSKLGSIERRHRTKVSSVIIASGQRITFPYNDEVILLDGVANM